VSLDIAVSTRTPGQRAPPKVRFGGYLIFASSAAAVAARGSDPLRWYVAVLLAAGLVLFVIAREARVYGMVDLSNPVVMSLISSVVIFGFIGAPNVFRHATRSPLLPPGNGPLFRALAAVGASMLCIWADSRLAEPLFRARPQPLSQLAARVPSERIFLVVVVGGLARVLLFVTGNLGYGTFGQGGDATGYVNWVVTANSLLPFATGMLLVDWFTTRRRASLHAAAALFVVEALTSVVAGVKGLVLSLLLFLGVTAVRAGRRPSLRLAAATVAFFLVVISPSVQAYRLQVDQGGTPTGLRSRITTPLSLVAGGSNNTLDTAKTAYQNTLTEERDLTTDIALIQARTPSIYPYEHGRRWTLAPLAAAVPRALWPGKPSLSNGSEIAFKYGGAPTAYGTSMPATLVGDEWIQFGWLGVIFASLVVGAIYRVVYTWVARRRNAGWTIALCFVVPTFLFGAGLDVASLLTAAGREFLVVGLAAAWVLRPTTNSTERRLV